MLTDVEGDVAVLRRMHPVTSHILIAAGIHAWFIGTGCEIHCGNGVQTLYIIWDILNTTLYLLVLPSPLP